jgi:hypothetical protein
LAAYLDLSLDSPVIDNLAWLGLLSDEPLPAGQHSPIDILTARMLDKMQYAPGERDMLILQHQFEAEYPDGNERIVSTMVDFRPPPRLHQHGPHRRPARGHRRQADPARPDRR